MSPTPREWHQRFLNQGQWTAQLRRYLIYHLGLDRASRILETGCGTGAITSHLLDYTQAGVYGIDLLPDYLRLAAQNDPRPRFIAGNALDMPFPANSFDAVLCHYFLLWVPQPAAALREMVRVTRPGGWVIAFAEPDYGGRIDQPAALEELGRLQTAALRRQGAEPYRGRQISGLFYSAGLQDIETGVIGGQWQGPPALAIRESEWSMLQADLNDLLPAERLNELHRQDEQAWQSGERVLFVPTFYAFGRKKT